MSLLNNNKLILLMCIVLINLNNNVIKKEIEQFEDIRIGCDHYLIRKIIIFAIVYMFTRDFKVAFIIALLFFIMNDLKNN